MQIGRGAAVAALLACSALRLSAQDGNVHSAEAEARSRELSKRMRVTLQQQSRELSRLERELSRAARADGRERDSIVRVTSRRIAELAGEIARVQAEADRVQFGSVDAETRAALLAQITSARAMANVTRALAGQQRALTFSTRTGPRGYLGVILSSEQKTELRDGKVFTEFVSPSVVVSVTAGSPAAKAGLEAGDTIVALGGNPLPGAVPMSDVVKPGEKLPVKIRRRGSERVVTVLVGTDPSAGNAPSVAYYDANGASMRICTGENCTPEVAGVRAPRPLGSVTITGVPGAPPVPPMTAVAPRVGSWTATDYTLAGAMMTTITAELESLIGRDEGILVLRVAPGTPAASSGLRGGDVIIRIDDDEISGVRELQRAVQRASSRGARNLMLGVVRKKKEQAITLQW
ncbi:MAG TPA: PDZ domain-containing protein [Gemmatimonadaceae bacterium]|nr:PDZ domain-containing protein [Gemmatimonadaceae bacterium]